MSADRVSYTSTTSTGSVLFCSSVCHHDSGERTSVIATVSSVAASTKAVALGCGRHLRTCTPSIVLVAFWCASTLSGHHESLAAPSSHMAPCRGCRPGCGVGLCVTYVLLFFSPRLFCS